MPSLVWKRVDGSELVDASLDGIDAVLPAASAIYLWRRRPHAPQSARATPEDCISWLTRLAGSPSAALGPKHLSHCVALDALRVGGGTIPPDKSSLLQTITKRRRPREFLVDFVETLVAFTPILYVGETNNLRNRIQQHLSGVTGLKPYLTDLLRLTWDDTELNYIILSHKADTSDDTKALQELLELLAQRLLAPFGTERPG